MLNDMYKFLAKWNQYKLDLNSLNIKPDHFSYTKNKAKSVMQHKRRKRK